MMLAAVLVAAQFPAWMASPRPMEVFRLRASHNDAVYNIPRLARDLNAVDVGHATAYEALVTGREEVLESHVWNQIVRTLKSPPRFKPDEKAIAPTFSRLYGELELVFDWAHVLHAQTMDVLASNLSDAQKETEIEKLWRFYRSRAPYSISGLPLNMEFLDSRPYSGNFRIKYPKVNALFWGYHWLQGAMYDMLYRVPRDMWEMSYDVVREQYFERELWDTNRDFMPMFAEQSPRFAARFPELANAFDNLHMLHDMVNDILADDSLDANQKRHEIRMAIWMVLDSTHANCESGEGEEKTLHDHRHMNGMPGMGMMVGSTPVLMYMPRMGWMSMEECHHCSMFMPDHDMRWRRSTVSIDGWTMEVRCPLCARDMAAQYLGRAILRLPTEDSSKLLVLVGDEMGNYTTTMKGVVFLEMVGEHPECNRWSHAFTSIEAFRKYVSENPQYKDAKPYTLEQWSTMAGKKPATYERKQGPVDNPYKNWHKGIDR
jgi:hypothetical protein